MNRFVPQKIAGNEISTAFVKNSVIEMNAIPAGLLKDGDTCDVLGDKKYKRVAGAWVADSSGTAGFDKMTANGVTVTADSVTGELNFVSMNDDLSIAINGDEIQFTKGEPDSGVRTFVAIDNDWILPRSPGMIVPMQGALDTTRGIMHMIGGFEAQTELHLEVNLNTGGVVAGVAFPTTVADGVVLYYNDHLYYFSGVHASIGQPFVKKLNLSTGVWTNLPNIPLKLTYSSGVVVGNKAYIAPGVGSAPSLQIFNFTSETWESAVTYPTAFFGISGVQKGTDIYYFGGTISGPVYQKKSYRFDTISKTFTPLADCPLATSFSVPYMSSDGTRILLPIGQTAAGVASDMVYAYNIASNTWDFAGYLPFSGGRSAGAGCSWNNVFYYFSGTKMPGEIWASHTNSLNVTGGAVESGELVTSNAPISNYPTDLTAAQAITPGVDTVIVKDGSLGRQIIPTLWYRSTAENQRYSSFGGVIKSPLPPVTPATLDAESVTYDNSTAGLIATNVQDAIDEVNTDAANAQSEVDALATVSSDTRLALLYRSFRPTYPKSSFSGDAAYKNGLFYAADPATNLFRYSFGGHLDIVGVPIDISPTGAIEIYAPADGTPIAFLNGTIPANPSYYNYNSNWGFYVPEDTALVWVHTIGTVGTGTFYYMGKSALASLSSDIPPNLILIAAYDHNEVMVTQSGVCFYNTNQLTMKPNVTMNTPVARASIIGRDTGLVTLVATLNAAFAANAPLAGLVSKNCPVLTEYVKGTVKTGGAERLETFKIVGLNEPLPNKNICCPNPLASGDIISILQQVYRL